VSGPIDLDRLYHLLPQYIRIRDVDVGEPLRGLLAVISEQVEVVEADIRQLYENWFIETCDEWAVPYIADLVGHRPVHAAGDPGSIDTLEGQLRNQSLEPRRELANVIANRRRKGTLALLDNLSFEIANWPGRAVELGRLVSVTQRMGHPRLDRGRIADLRYGDPLDRAGGPFDELAHTVDLRRPDSSRTPGRYNLAAVGLFAWRMRSFPVDRAPAFAYDRISKAEDDGNKYLFSPLGNYSLLYTQPIAVPDSDHISDELNLPVPIRLRALAERTSDYYGVGKSLIVWRDGIPVPADSIIAADLTNWKYVPRGSQVAVDPRRGLIAFSPENEPEDSVLVSYHYGFGAPIGGGGYPRPAAKAADYFVGANASGPNAFKTIAAALSAWRAVVHDTHDVTPRADAIIEITDSAEYGEVIEIRLPPARSDQEPPPNLTLRAADGQRPSILLDQPAHHRDAFLIAGEHHTDPAHLGGVFTLDGLLVSGWLVHVHGSLTEVRFRHCTLVPGLALELDCSVKHREHPSLKITNTTAWVTIEQSIFGAIRVEQSDLEEPVRLEIADTILDAISPDHLALHGDCEGDFALASVLMERCTTMGGIKAHELRLAENCIFYGAVLVDRRQVGCVRFCYVPQGSRTPKRYECQPDSALAHLEPTGDGGAAETATLLRVRPLFESTRYGTPTYARLADACPAEIRRGAEDESEMGAFHDLFEPQREANLRGRLAEFTPAGTDAGLILPSGDEHDS
jgi:hypothetical protein